MFSRNIKIYLTTKPLDTYLQKTQDIHLSIMATRQVRFIFACDLNKLTYIHNLPRSLVTVDGARNDAGYVSRFVSAIRPIMNEHQAACRAASNPRCENCGLPTVTILQTPMSWLHVVNDPFVNIWVDPVCGRGECETKIRQQIQSMMAEMQKAGPGPSSTPREVMPCNICGKAEATKRCGKCKTVAYCGQEHQKADWKVHQKSCVPKDDEAN